MVVIALTTADAGPEWTFPFIGALAYNAVLACGVALSLWFYTLRHLPAGTVLGWDVCSPRSSGVIASWVQLGERPDPRGLVGMVLIIVDLASLAGWQMAAGRKAARAVAAHLGAAESAAPQTVAGREPL